MKRCLQKHNIALFSAGLAVCAALLLFSALAPEGQTMARRFAVSTAAYLSFCCAAALAGRSAKPEALYACLALFLGIAYLFVVTPMAVPDEEHHYRMSLTLSNYLLLRFEDPMSVPAYLLDFHGFARHKCVAAGCLRVLDGLLGTASDTGKTAATGLSAGGYLLFYLPQTLGVTLGRLLRLSMTSTFLLGRFFNLLFYSACVFLAVRRTPRYKTLLGAAAMLPMALQQAASLSYDGFTNGAALVFTAELISAVSGEGTMDKKQYVRLLLAGIFLAPAKGAYMTMLPLSFLIPSERFGSRREKARYAWLLTAAGIAALAVVYLPGILSGGASESSALNWEGGHNYTVGYALRHPLEIIAIILRSFAVRLPRWAFTSAGGILGGTSLVLPYWIAGCILSMVWLSGSGLCESADGPTSKTRVCFLLAAAGTALLFLVTMLFTWTSDDRTIIQGVQGRYFIPVLPLCMIALRWKPAWKKDLRQWLPPAMAAANALCLWLLLQYTLSH